MRLLEYTAQKQIKFARQYAEHERPRYAILSHCWGEDKDEVKFSELETAEGKRKPGYNKIRFCAEQARKDDITHFWVDTCCIDKDSSAELSEAINSMFRWYKEAEKCYVYLPEVSTAPKRDHDDNLKADWQSNFCNSRWFKRGWTLQELLAPATVEFFSKQGHLLGTKKSLAPHIHEITTIPLAALGSAPLSQFPVPERMRWADKRQTKKKEDKAYCLLGIFEVFIPFIYGEGDNAMWRLQKAIEEKSGSAARTNLVHWRVPQTANSIFTGREALLRDLEVSIRSALYDLTRHTTCRIVISGIGGQGKSELALQLAQRLRHLFWAVLWVDVGSSNVASKSFLDIAAKLSLPATTWEDVRHRISNLQHPWLLVLDNADDVDTDYQKYFPDSSQGVLVMTTRNDECHQYANTTPVALPGLALEEAQDLLFKAASIPPEQHNEHEEQATAVATLLQSHALALVQAGAYIARGHCTLAEYPRLYQSQRQRLMTFRPTQAQSRYRDVYATFEVSATALASMGTIAAEDALLLLPILAVGAPNQFPLWLFEMGWKGAKMIPHDRAEDAEDVWNYMLTPWHVANLPLFIPIESQSWDPFRLTEAVNLLKAFSLLTSQIYHNSIHVTTHPLIHAWARDRQTMQQRQDTWLQVGCLVALALDVELSPQQVRDLQAHVTAATDCLPDDLVVRYPKSLVVRALMRCVNYLTHQQAHWIVAVSLKQIFRVLGLEPGEVHKEYMGLYREAAWNSQHLGNVKQSIVILEDQIQIAHGLSEKDAGRLMIQNMLAAAYLENGQVERAVELFEKVVKIRSRTLDEDHPNRLISQHELARAYLKNRQMERAVELFEKVVEIRSRTLDEDHPHQLTSQHELARAYLENGQVERAVELLEKVVEIESRTLDEDHPDQLTSQRELAMAYLKNGQVERAIELLETVVEIRSRILDEDHADRLGSQHELARALWEAGKKQRAYSIMYETVQMYKSRFNASYHDRVVAEDNLAYYEDEMDASGLDEPTQLLDGRDRQSVARNAPPDSLPQVKEQKTKTRWTRLTAKLTQSGRGRRNKSNAQGG